MNSRRDNSPGEPPVGATLLSNMDGSEQEKPDINRTDRILVAKKQRRTRTDTVGYKLLKLNSLLKWWLGTESNRRHKDFQF